MTYIPNQPIHECPICGNDCNCKGKENCPCDGAEICCDGCKFCLNEHLFAQWVSKKEALPDKNKIPEYWKGKVLTKQIGQFRPELTDYWEVERNDLITHWLILSTPR